MNDEQRINFCSRHLWFIISVLVHCLWFIQLVHQGSPVHVEDLTRNKRCFIRGEKEHGLCHILGFSEPLACGRQADAQLRIKDSSPFSKSQSLRNSQGRFHHFLFQCFLNALFRDPKGRGCDTDRSHRFSNLVIDRCRHTSNSLLVLLVINGIPLFPDAFQVFSQQVWIGNCVLGSSHQSFFFKEAL